MWTATDRALVRGSLLKDPIGGKPYDISGNSIKLSRPVMTAPREKRWFTAIKMGLHTPAIVANKQTLCFGVVSLIVTLAELGKKMAAAFDDQFLLTLNPDVGVYLVVLAGVCCCWAGGVGLVIVVPPPPYT